MHGLVFTWFWTCSMHSEVLTPILFLALLCFWRIWRFTISPLFHPEAPPVYPYWVPVFGHLLSFMRDADGTITRARNYFGNSREPFALVLAGKYIYFITSAKDMSSVFKNVAQLTFDEYVRNISIRIGMTPKSIENLWRQPSQEDIQNRPNAFPNPSRKCVAHLGESIFKAQLHPGQQAEKLWISILEKIHTRLVWDKFPVLPAAKGRSEEKTISLRQLLYSTLVESTTTAFFGRALLDIEPNLLEDFAQFDESGWKLGYRVPAPWAQDMLSAKKKVSSAFQEYTDLPVEQRSESCWVVHTLEEELREIGMGTQDIGLQLFLLYWVSNGNPWKVAFWLITRILYDTHLRERVEEEIYPYINAEPNLSPNELALKLESCAVLMATFHEVLRTTAGSKTARRIQDTCIIGGKRLEKGGQILIPHRQILLDKKVFGPDAEEFNVHRFIQEPSLSRNPAFRPFGGGVTYCPGRFLARKEILTITSLILGRFKVKMANEKQRFPVMEQELPSLGIMGPKLGEDVSIQVSNSKSE